MAEHRARCGSGDGARGVESGVGASAGVLCGKARTFQAAGIVSQLTRVSRGAESIAGVANGSLDIGIATPEAVGNAVIHGLPLQMIGTGSIFIEPSPFGLYALKTTNLKDPSAFKNTVIGVAALNDNLTLGVWSWLAKNGIDRSAVKMIEMPFSTMPTALDRGNVQACSLAEPFVTPNKERLQLIPGVYDTLGKGWALGVWFTNKEFAAKNPDVIKKYMNAVYAVAKTARTNPETIVPLLVEYSGMTPETVKGMIRQQYAESSDESQVAGQLDEALKFQMIPRKLTYRELMGA